MRRNLNILMIILYLTLTFIACAGNGENTGSRSGNDEDAIRAVMSDHESAIKDGDVNAWIDCYTDIDNIDEAKQKFHQALGRGIEIKSIEVSNIIVDGNKATAHIKITAEAYGETDSTTDLAFWEKTSEGWKIIYKGSEKQ